MPGSNGYGEYYEDYNTIPSDIPINTSNTNTSVNNGMWVMEDSQHNRQVWYGEDSITAERYYNESRDIYSNDDDSYNYVFNLMNNPNYYLDNGELTNINIDKEDISDTVIKQYSANVPEDKDYDKLIYDGVQIKGTRIQEDTNYGLHKDESIESPLVFFPYYKVSDYSKDLNNFRKQVNPFGQKGCFYFKIFFNFDMGYGLLGDINSPNTALHYLNNIKNLSMYKSEQINDKINALEKFINSLKVLSVDTPWFFKEISNLNNINDMFITDDDFSSESFVNVHCNYEATDMRLGTLFNLYKYACYNSLRNKEILPPNLRKFDMSILFMHVPLKNYHTAFNYYGTNIGQKKLNVDPSSDVNNIMSVKMLTFYNCEFDIKSMNEMNDSVSNETMFELGGNILKINYGRVYEHRINEFEGFGIGPDGFIFDLAKEGINGDGNVRLEMIANQLSAILREQIPNVIDDSEAIAKHIGSEYYTNKIRRLHQVTFNPANIYSNFTNVRSHYYQSKIKNLKNGINYEGNLFGLFNIGRKEDTRVNYNRNKSKVINKINEQKSGDLVQNLNGMAASVNNTENISYKLSQELNKTSEFGNDSGNSYYLSYTVNNINNGLHKVSEFGNDSGNSYGLADKIIELDAKLNKQPESGEARGFSYDLTSQIKDIEDTLAKVSEFGSDSGNSYYLASTLENIKAILNKTPEFADNSGNSYYLSYTLNNIDKILNKVSEFGNDSGNSYYLSYTLNNIEKILNKTSEFGSDYGNSYKLSDKVNELNEKLNKKPAATADRGFSYDLKGQVEDISYKLARVSEFLTDRGNSYDLKGQVEDIKNKLAKASEFTNNSGNSYYLSYKVNDINNELTERNRKYENIYGYFYGRFGYIMENRINTDYLNQKLRQLKKNLS